MYRHEREPFDPARLRNPDPFALNGLARLRTAVAAASTGTTQKMTADDLKALDLPKRGARIRVPEALGGGTARFVRWIPDGDLYALTKKGLREPFHVAAADIENPPPKPRSRWTLRRTR